MAFVPVQVECSDRDLHSGVYGGSVHEAMTDLIALMGERGAGGQAWVTRGRVHWAYFQAALSLCGHIRNLQEPTSICFLTGPPPSSHPCSLKETPCLTSALPASALCRALLCLVTTRRTLPCLQHPLGHAQVLSSPGRRL